MVLPSVIIKLMISAHHLYKKEDQRTILEDINLSIHPGERVCIMGQSGSGKTLLLRLLLGLEKPTQGTVDIDGAPLHLLPSSIRRLYHLRSAFIRQSDMLPDNETVSEIVALPLILQNTSPQIANQKTLKILASLNLISRAGSFAQHLAQGEQKLVAIARALIPQPVLLFADEPLEHLDAIQSAHACNLFKKINSEGTTLILASRNSVLAQELHCRTLILNNGQLSGEKESPLPPSVTDRKTLERSVKITAVK